MKPRMKLLSGSEAEVLAHVAASVGTDITRTFMLGVYLDMDPEEVPDVTALRGFPLDPSTETSYTGHGVLVATDGRHMTMLYLSEYGLARISRGQELKSGYVSVDAKNMLVRPLLVGACMDGQFPNWRRIMSSLCDMRKIASMGNGTKEFGRDFECAKWCQKTGVLINPKYVYTMPMSGLSMCYGTVDGTGDGLPDGDGYHRADPSKRVMFIDSWLSLGRLISVVMPIAKV